MNENETIADILREMRDEQRNDFLTNSDLRHLADRIEAAAKLTLHDGSPSDETAKSAAQAAGGGERPARFGNAAAMRDALGTAKIWAETHIAGAELCGYKADDMATALVPRLDAALAAPARNCDRFATRDEAFNAWSAETGGTRWDAATREVSFTHWLYETAKGGAK